MTKSKSFDLKTVKGHKQAERFKAMLENKGYSVEMRAIGRNTILITGRPVRKAATNPRRRKRITARRSPLLPAKVRVNPRTGKVQVFVSPKVAAQVKGRNPLTGSSSRIPVALKYLIVDSNGKSYKATNLSEVNRMKRVLKNQGVTFKVVKLPKGSTTWNT
jgi:hypothetical protein